MNDLRPTHNAEQKSSGEALALAVLVTHPDWSNVQVAKAIGRHRGTLYRYRMYTDAKKLLAEQGKRNRLTRQEDIQRGLESCDPNCEADN